MPYCENCGTKLSLTANFCFNCGNAAVHNIKNVKQVELFNNTVELNLDQINKSERKRKWTDEALINELLKYKSVEDFKSNNYNIWLLFKKRNLAEKLQKKEEVKNATSEFTSLKTKQISVLEYSKKINPKHFRENRKFPNNPVSRHSIFYRIKNNLPLPEVIKYDKVGKVHVLTVDVKF